MNGLLIPIAEWVGLNGTQTEHVIASINSRQKI